MAPRRVLVVDDTRATADLVGLLLLRLGHEVRAAYDGRSALALADEFHPEVAFVDLAMPEMDGFELAGLLRKKLGTTLRIIALSADVERVVQQATKAAGFDAQLIKPATAKTIADVLTG